MKDKISLINIQKYLDLFPGSRILVVGDLMVDEFIWGSVERISPEGPVPVVNVEKETLRLGGAANVVKNIFTLGGKVYVCGVVGEDIWSDYLIQEIEKMGIKSDGIIKEGSRRTTLKTRIIGNNQQIVRYDREDYNDIFPSTKQKFLSYINKNLADIDGIIISDYGKGVITKELLNESLPVLKRAGKIIGVDPKISHFDTYHGVTIITPNRIEVGAGLGITVKNSEDIKKAGGKLLEKLGCEAVLVTQGEEGMTLFHKAGNVSKIPTMAREVYDVTGAGDTVIAACILSLISGASFYEAAVIANLAAGRVVGKLGTAFIDKDELSQTIKSYQNLFS
ncbi:MAG: D-glycero-beta-D-manno-heptose-7-phosphate kinase [Thermodesulfobacteriota bacterium]|nr:D-glycero-beta-D-manno-heptose-7-phosphate kinase [Thermodesulfobacteriota bacterium]